MFNVGGTFPFLRDQVYFSGLDEYAVLTPSVVTAGLGWNFNLWSEFYIAPKLNAAYHSFDIEKISDFDSNNLLFGGGLSFGYLAPMGPLKATFSYSPQLKKVLGYINLGWSF